MKIVHLETGRQLYGGARQVAELVEGLATLGCDNVLVCRPGAAIAKVVTSAAHHCRVIELPMHGDLDISLYYRLRKILRREVPDILHVHSRNGGEDFGGRAAVAEQIPSVLTRRVDNAEPRWWARRKFNRFDRVVSISRPIERWLIGTVGIEPGRVTHISSCVDPSRFAPRGAARAVLAERYDVRSTDIVIGAVGQLIQRKGYDLLIDAMAVLSLAHPAVRLLLFGRGPQAARLQRRIAAAGLAERVALVGFAENLPAMLAGCDLFVHPARSEGLGVAVLEAMACRVPIIATDVGGLADIVVPGQTAMRVPAEDISALASAIAGALDDSASSQARAEAAHQQVLAGHNRATMAQSYLGVYTDLLGAGALPVSAAPPPAGSDRRRAGPTLA